MDAVHEWIQAEKSFGFRCSDETGAWRCVYERLATGGSAARGSLPEPGKRACEPLEPNEHALIGRRGYNPAGCTRLERTAKMPITFDNGIYNGLTPP
jgi:hypothetical protein